MSNDLIDEIKNVIKVKQKKQNDDEPSKSKEKIKLPIPKKKRSKKKKTSQQNLLLDHQMNPGQAEVASQF